MTNIFRFAFYFGFSALILVGCGDARNKDLNAISDFSYDTMMQQVPNGNFEPMFNATVKMKTGVSGKELVHSCTKYILAGFEDDLIHNLAEVELALNDENQAQKDALDKKFSKSEKDKIMAANMMLAENMGPCIQQATTTGQIPGQ